MRMPKPGDGPEPNYDALDSQHLVSPYAAITETEERRVALLLFAETQDIPRIPRPLRDIIDAIAPTARAA